MAFFEELGKKLTDAGQNVAQQTKNFADVAQLNSAIADAERKINQIYVNLGQSYYEKYKDDGSVDGANFIAEIQALKTEIQTNHNKINDIKGVKKCENCGLDVPINSTFCSRCGSRIVDSSVELVTTNNRLCPTCNAIVAADDVYCNNCGTKIETSPTTLA